MSQHTTQTQAVGLQGLINFENLEIGASGGTFDSSQAATIAYRPTSALTTRGFELASYEPKHAQASPWSSQND